jgi:uncharacterized membrane protein YdbT with pleckstrin-like domain
MENVLTLIDPALKFQTLLQLAQLTVIVLVHRSFVYILWSWGFYCILKMRTQMKLISHRVFQIDKAI